MEPGPRLYLCRRCHKQVIICRKCDRGNIYCADGCATSSRIISLRLAGSRYQSTLRGKYHHARRQALYRSNHPKKVTHQGSLFSTQNDSIHLPENKAEKTEKKQNKTVYICSFCKKPVSHWLRNDFLRRRSHKKSELQAFPQAP